MIDLSRRCLRVWRRNLLVYRRSWMVNFLAPMCEPLFYLSAFGLGVGGLVGEVDYAGGRLSYPAFIAPGLAAMAVMWNAFLETTYSSFVRMHYQRTYEAILATPVSAEEIAAGEILWAATKSAAACLLMLLVIAAMGYTRLPDGLVAVAFGLLGGLAFGASGLVFTAVLPTIDMFNLPVFLFATPVFLFCGAFFPVDSMPGWAQALAACLPMYHIVEPCRFFMTGLSATHPLASLGYLAVYDLAAFLLAAALLKRRLIR